MQNVVTRVLYGGGALGFPLPNYDVIIASTATIGYTTQ